MSPSSIASFHLALCGKHISKTRYTGKALRPSQIRFLASDSTDSVEGAYLHLTDAQLAATDDYEVSDYVRRLVTLTSGIEAFVYVADE